MTYDSDQFFEYDFDGDRIDKRERIIRKLERKVKDFERRENHETYLRKKNPALQDAWEKYQSILRLVEHA